MADPVTAWAATGAAASIIQIVEFAAKLVKETRELMNSQSNALRSNMLVEQFTLMHSNLADQIVDSNNSNGPIPNTGEAVVKLARECKKVSSDLLKELDEMKVTDGLNGPTRVWQSARKARRALAKRSAIEQQRRYLSELTGQLSTAVLLDLRSTQMSGLDDIYNRVGEAEARNASLIVESRDAILKASEYPNSEANSIFDSLWFPEMRLRRNDISKAYEDTFSWLFTNRSPFRSWLMDSSDVFWVTGKAGSGKSTSMKYLANHRLTRDLLSTWAGMSKIVIAQNYMWNPGLAMQRNEEGMLQEILFQILSSDRNLIDLISKKRHCDLQTLHFRDSWSKPELMQALKCIFEHTGTYTRYCLFVDGLDECEGEHNRLVATIMTLSKYANVKVCISSRPWNVFRNAFEHLEAKIYIHELTKGDICTYVNGKLGRLLSNDSFAVELISGIVEKAQGVFLWVFLVVRSLLEGFEEGDSVHIMRQRLHDFPADLEDYFRHMLSRVSRNYRHHTTKALSLASKMLTKNGSHQIRDSNSFLSFWLLSQGHLDKPQFAYDYQPHYVTVKQLQDMAETTKRYLNACCKDFLHVTGGSLGPEQLEVRGCALDHNPRVDYLHRTVYDFLHSAEMQQFLGNEIPEHFNRPDFRTCVALAQGKVKGEHDEHFCQSCSRAIRSAIKLVPGVTQEQQTMVEFEVLAVDLLSYPCDDDCCYHAVTGGNMPHGNVLEDMCIAFATYNLHEYINCVSKRFPGCISSLNRVGNREILRATLGLSSRRSFSICRIDLQLLHTVLRACDYRELYSRGLAKKFGEKAAYEAQSWTKDDHEHFAAVMRVLIFHGMDLSVLPRDLTQRLGKYMPQIARLERRQDTREGNRTDLKRRRSWATDKTEQIARKRRHGW